MTSTRVARPKVRDDLTVVEIDGESVVYDDKKKDLVHLNQTATIVFQLADGSGTVRELAEDVADVFGVPVPRVQRHIRSVLRELHKSSLMEGDIIPEHVHEHSHEGEEDDAREHVREHKGDNP